MEAGHDRISLYPRCFTLADKSLTGFSVGGGVEQGLSQNVSLIAEPDRQGLGQAPGCRSNGLAIALARSYGDVSRR
jgi:hypothetical protein